MKRSDMVKLIKDYILGISALDDAELDLAANQLLTYIEDTGILPPEANIKMTRQLAPDQEITWTKLSRQWEAE